MRHLLLLFLASCAVAALPEVSSREDCELWAEWLARKRIDCGMTQEKSLELMHEEASQCRTVALGPDVDECIVRLRASWDRCDEVVTCR